MITNPSAMELPPPSTLSEAEITGVASGLVGADPSHEPLYGGSNPDVFRIAGSLGRGVLKFYAVGSQQAEFEAYSMERARSAGLPVPSVNGMDVVETADGKRPWLAMEHAVGRSVESLDLATHEEAAILRSIGRLIADLHSPSQPTPDGYYRQTGLIDGSPTWSFKTWDDYLHFTGERLSGDAKFLYEAGLSVTEVDKVLDNIPGYSAMGSLQTVLTYADWQMVHVYVDEDLRVSSIIDWGSAQSNSPEREYAKSLCSNDEPMIDAYATASGIPRAELDERILRMRISHIPGLVISNMKRGRVEVAHDRVNDFRRLFVS
jgi:Ser/Thr protein kinase RdoA (MazF antagonist)